MSDMVTISFPASEMRKFQNWIKLQTEEKTGECRTIVGGIIRGIERKAKMAAPVNKKIGQGGFLRSSIHSAITTSGLGGMVFTGRNYAPFQEWGTGDYVKVPSFVRTMFGVDSIRWKGAGIRKVNIHAHPYLFENAKIGYTEMLNKLKSIGFK